MMGWFKNIEVLKVADNQLVLREVRPSEEGNSTFVVSLNEIGLYVVDDLREGFQKLEVVWSALVSTRKSP